MSQAKGYTGNNKYIKELIEQVYTETGINRVAIWSAIYHFLTWQWCSFHNAEFLEYIWDRCFVFKFFNHKRLVKQNNPEAEQHIKIRRHLSDIDVDISSFPQSLISEVDDLCDSHNPETIMNAIRKRPIILRRLSSDIRLPITRTIYHNLHTNEYSWNKGVILSLTEQQRDILLHIIKNTTSNETTI